MKLIIHSVIVLICSSLAFSMNLHKEVNLEGEWKFEIGDKEDYSSAYYNDSHWEKINVPNSWENEGFPGYDGYAWYRIAFRIEKNLRGKPLYLKLGRIDDVDMTYLNGHFIGGEGKMPPDYQTAWDVKRLYPLPAAAINYGGRNVIAVRVYDSQVSGGIYRDEVGIFSRLDVVNLSIDLSGYWKFNTGDGMQWKNPDFDDSQWKEIQVPSFWEDEGYSKLDGFAWFRKKVILNKKLANLKLILLLGKINDADEVYFNGELIGSTGIFPDKGNFAVFENSKEIYRAYFISPELVRENDFNTIAVRVFDYGKNGGIYSDYIGLVTRNEYLKYIKFVK